jgi:hypothetical protein
MNSRYISTPLEAQAVDRDAAELDAWLDAELLGLAMAVIDRGGTPEDVLNVGMIQRSLFERWKARGPEILKQFRLFDVETRRRLTRSLSRCVTGGRPKTDGTREGCAVFQISDSRRERWGEPV